jgi:type IV pilus biogenesis protein CpaD/CtpE
MTIRRNLTLLLVLLSGAALQGCASTPRFNEHFGTAVRANLSAQVINPAAAANADPVFGVDGAAARAAQERYQRSFKESDASADRPLVNASGTK